MIARALILGYDNDPDLLAGARALLNKHNGNGLTISHGAIGEVFLTTKNSFNRGERLPPIIVVSKKLQDFISDNKFLVCGLPTDFNIVKMLMDSDGVLKPADALILASAISCSNCTTLYTTDRTLLTSQAVRKKSEEIRKELFHSSLEILELPVNQKSKKVLRSK